MTRFDYAWLLCRRVYQIGTGIGVFYYASRNEFQSAIFVLVFFVIAWNWD